MILRALAVQCCMVCALMWGSGPAQAAVTAKLEAYGFAAEARTGGPGKPAATFTQTDRIPARAGVRFGLQFSLAGLEPNRQVVLRKVFVHPAMTLPNGNVVGGFTTEETFKAGADGKLGNFAGFSFDQPHELKPGPWKMEVWMDTEKLVERQFVVVAAEESASPCEANVPAGYPRDFPFVRGGAPVANAAVPGAFVFTVPDKALVAALSTCLKQAGWNARLRQTGTPDKPDFRHQITAERGARQVRATIFASGGSTYMVVVE